MRDIKDQLFQNNSGAKSNPAKIMIAEKPKNPIRARSNQASSESSMLTPHLYADEEDCADRFTLPHDHDHNSHREHALLPLLHQQL